MFSTSFPELFDFPSLEVGIAVTLLLDHVPTRLGSQWLPVVTRCHAPDRHRVDTPPSQAAAWFLSLQRIKRRASSRSATGQRAMLMTLGIKEVSNSQQSNRNASRID